MKTCTIDGCNNKHRARGLCSTHYNQAHLTNRHRQFTRTCDTCGTEYQTPRKDGRFCSDQCKGDAYRTATVSRLPRNHPVRVAMRAARQAVPWECACEWCGTEFTTTRSLQRMCSVTCKIKAKRCRRRGRAAGSKSHYTWAEVMRLFIKLGRRCAYCEQPITGQPDPDHVIPLSRGGSNSITNILPCCRACNSDKRDLLPDEWARDRARRGLPAVNTDVTHYIHLAISPAA